MGKRHEKLLIFFHTIPICKT